MEWVDEHGTISDFSFMVFGPLDEEQQLMLIKGITIQLMMNAFTEEIMSYCKDISEKEATVLGTCQGVNFHILLPKNRRDLEKVIKTTTLDGLRFLRLKCEYIGFMEIENNV